MHEGITLSLQNECSFFCNFYLQIQPPIPISFFNLRFLVCIRRDENKQHRDSNHTITVLNEYSQIRPRDNNSSITVINHRFFTQKYLCGGCIGHHAQSNWICETFFEFLQNIFMARKQLRKNSIKLEKISHLFISKSVWTNKFTHTKKFHEIVLERCSYSKGLYLEPLRV